MLRFVLLAIFLIHSSKAYILYADEAAPAEGNEFYKEVTDLVKQQTKEGVKAVVSLAQTQAKDNANGMVELAQQQAQNNAEGFMGLVEKEVESNAEEFLTTVQKESEANFQELTENLSRKKRQTYDHDLEIASKPFSNSKVADDEVVRADNNPSGLNSLIPSQVKEQVPAALGVLNSTDGGTMLLGGFSVLMMPMPRGSNVASIMQGMPGFMNLLPGAG